jgi:hypothetical protein
VLKSPIVKPYVPLDTICRNSLDPDELEVAMIGA